MNIYQAAVRNLESRGWSLTAIARETGASIGAISDLKHGRTREPRASVGVALLGIGGKPAPQQLQRRALIQPANALADQAQVLTSLGDEGVAAKTQQDHQDT